MTGFDFGFTSDGEIIVDPTTHDIAKAMDDDLRIQAVFNRLKSVSHNWYVDEIGADLEEIIGKPCTKEIAEYGKQKIIAELTEDGLWSTDDILVTGNIKDNTHIVYTIYLRMYQSETEDTYSYEIETELDLVKGVFIRYGWGQKKHFQYLNQPMITNTIYNINTLNTVLANAHAFIDTIDYVIVTFGSDPQLIALKTDTQNCIDTIGMLKLGYGTAQQYQDILSYNVLMDREIQDVLETIRNNSGGM